MTTIIHEGIEFILPGIYKAYPRKWAEDLIRNGILYFTNLEIFQTDEDQARGDCLEGTGIVIRQGVRCTTSHSNPIFACCFTMETDRKSTLATWKDRDTVIQVCDTLKLAKRIHDTAKALPGIVSMQVGPVTYDKDEGSRRAYQWGEALFQKNLRFSGQKEFRFALIGDHCHQDKNNLILALGDCSDFLRIAE